SQLTLQASTFSSGWRAAGEIPARAVAEGYIPNRFGVIDSAQGGYTSRTNASIHLVSHLSPHATLENQLWYSHYFFNLISNFTFYYFYPATGDEFRQHETRDLAGVNSRLSLTTPFGAATLTSAFGAAARYDDVHPGFIAHTQEATGIVGYI